MGKPDPIPASLYITQLVEPLAARLSLRTLPSHAHEVLLGFLWYHFIYHILSPLLSRLLLPRRYPAFPSRTRINWDIHVVSLIQSLSINTAALYVIWVDDERRNLDWRGRLWAYSPLTGMVQGFAAGYFLWDVQVSLQTLSVSGVGAVVHAVGALTVTCIGFRPFGIYYGLNFVLYELSTPFLNVHWFLDKLDRTGSRLQLYNGILLMVTFFLCRVVWGTYQSVRIYSDMWTALTARSSMAPVEQAMGQGNCQGQSSRLRDSCEAGDLPTWLVIVYLLGNTVLSLLNIYWFGKMITAVRKRFQSPGEIETKVESKAGRGERKSQ